jgi:hypothetical protein
LEKELNTPTFEKYGKIVGFEVFTAVTMKNSVFLDVVLLEVYCKPTFRRKCGLYLQGRRNNRLMATMYTFLAHVYLLS